MNEVDQINDRYLQASLRTAPPCDFRDANFGEFRLLYCSRVGNFWPHEWCLLGGFIEAGVCNVQTSSACAFSVGQILRHPFVWFLKSVIWTVFRAEGKIFLLVFRTLSKPVENTHENTYKEYSMRFPSCPSSIDHTSRRNSNFAPDQSFGNNYCVGKTRCAINSYLHFPISNNVQKFMDQQLQFSQLTLIGSYMHVRLFRFRVSYRQCQ